MSCVCPKFRVFFVRHGESEWTFMNRFCGWVDVSLTEKGRLEALRAATALKEENAQFDIAFTSLLSRANETLEIILKQINQTNLPVVRAWQLNERHYGDLTGYNKAEMAEKYGLEQIWRRSFDILPPPMDENHKYYTDIADNPKFLQIKDKIPKVESLKTTMLRTIPFWNNDIVPCITSGKKVLLVCHGTTLRGIVKHLNQITDEEIMRLNLPTAIPFYYDFDENMTPVVLMKFLSDEETVKKAMAKVADIGEKK
ncbi:Phosphoglycerate mutase 2 [Blattella germanica]|nr:Phosphoglycerate mutase 2 [Blattella germanica]